MRRLQRPCPSNPGINLDLERTALVKGPGSDFMPELGQYIEDGETIICSPHVLYSPLPRVNDIGLRLRSIANALWTTEETVKRLGTPQVSPKG